jgi:hypothetical protein
VRVIHLHVVREEAGSEILQSEEPQHHRAFRVIQIVPTELDDGMNALRIDPLATLEIYHTRWAFYGFACGQSSGICEVAELGSELSNSR